MTGQYDESTALMLIRLSDIDNINKNAVRYAQMIRSLRESGKLPDEKINEEIIRAITQKARSYVIKMGDAPIKDESMLKKYVSNPSFLAYALENELLPDNLVKRLDFGGDWNKRGFIAKHGVENLVDVLRGQYLSHATKLAALFPKAEYAEK